MRWCVQVLGTLYTEWRPRSYLSAWRRMVKLRLSRHVRTSLSRSTGRQRAVSPVQTERPVGRLASNNNAFANIYCWWTSKACILAYTELVSMQSKLVQNDSIACHAYKRRWLIKHSNSFNLDLNDDKNKALYISQGFARVMYHQLNTDDDAVGGRKFPSIN
jgi:hypothetical protein